jgi:hypothetical protein
LLTYGGFGQDTAAGALSGGGYAFSAPTLVPYTLTVTANKYELSGAFSGISVTPAYNLGNPRFLVNDGSLDGFGVMRGTTSENGHGSMAFYADNRAGVTNETGVVSYQSYGYWNMAWATATANVDYSAFSVGQSTPPDAIPTAGAARFQGHLLGQFVAGGSLAAVEVAAPMALDVDFAARTASFSAPDWRSTSNIYAGTSLSGTLTYQPQQNALAGTLTTANGQLTGPASGRFYGPTAGEVGGMFSLGPAVGGSDHMFGAFGAAR